MTNRSSVSASRERDQRKNAKRKRADMFKKIKSDKKKSADTVNKTGNLFEKLLAGLGGILGSIKDLLGGIGGLITGGFNGLGLLVQLVVLLLVLYFIETRHWV